MNGHITLGGQPPQPLTASRYLIGRGDGCDILLPEADGAVSRRHALMERDAQGGWGVVDLGSQNGTLVNGQRLTDRHALLDGDRIQVGRNVMTLSLPQSQPTVVLAPRAQPTVAVPTAPLPAAMITPVQPWPQASLTAASPMPHSPLPLPVEAPASLPLSLALPPAVQRAAAQPAEWAQARRAAQPAFDCLASPWLRLGATILGGFTELALLAGAVIGLCSSLLGGLLAGFAPQLGGQAAGGGLLVFGVICLILWLAYLPWYFSCLAKGTTPAKKMLGLMVVTEDGTQAVFGTMFARDVALKVWLGIFAYILVAVIPFFGGFLSLALMVGLAIMILTDVNHQAWYDRLMHTYVVETSKAQMEQA